MIFNFTVTEDESIYEEVKQGKYGPLLTLTLISVEEEERKIEVKISDGLRKFLGENLYVHDVLPLEYAIRCCLFGKGLSDKDIEKGIKKIKKKWAKTRKCGDYAITV